MALGALSVFIYFAVCWCLDAGSQRQISCIENAIEAGDPDAEYLSLVQRRYDLHRGRPNNVEVASANMLQADRKRRMLPVFWVHVPKCGSGFVNTLIHTPEVCDIDENEFIGTSMGGIGPDAFMHKNQQHCLGIVASGPEHAFCDHDGFGKLYEDNVGKAVIMLRQPEQRLMSAYYFDQAAWPWQRPAENVRQYAEVAAGCAVRMLTRSGRWKSHAKKRVPNPCGGPEPPTDAEVVLAKQRLRQGFAFVGLTESWSLSVCLYHKMFGGRCRAFELNDTHPGPRHTNESYDVSPLQGFTDKYDGELYTEAKAIFTRRLSLFNVSHESCKSCFLEAASRWWTT